VAAALLMGMDTLSCLGNTYISLSGSIFFSIMYIMCVLGRRQRYSTYYSCIYHLLYIFGHFLLPMYYILIIVELRQHLKWDNFCKIISLERLSSPKRNNSQPQLAGVGLSSTLPVAVICDPMPIVSCNRSSPSIRKPSPLLSLA